MAKSATKQPAARLSAGEILSQLKAQANDGYKRILQKHGIPEPILGVKIEFLKTIQKQVKKDYHLALELYDSGIYDARYLAGLIADAQQMTKKDLRHWLATANSAALCQYTIPWVAAESNHGHGLALEWIESKKEFEAIAGWATLGSLVSIKDDAELDLAELKQLLARVQKTIHQAPNLVRYVMNGFVIAVGCYVKDLTELALKTAASIGTVEVDMGDTACQVPSAVDYLKKVQACGTIGKKRKTAKC
jgi:3-methyladenine DNA glycosylase AlkD